MSGLPPKPNEEKEDSDGEEKIRLDPCCVFDRYFHEKDGKGAVKGKGSRG